MALCDSPAMPTTLFEFAGGEPAFLALATAHHARCLADPELNHPFSHGDLDPQHVQHLAAYWAEVMGGPPRCSTLPANQSSLLRTPPGNGDMTDLGRRFVECFVAAADDAGLPADPEFRDQLRAVMAWPVADALEWADEASQVPGGHTMPRWTWDGLAGPAA